jgi:hypothetical protein
MFVVPTVDEHLQLGRVVRERVVVVEAVGLDVPAPRGTSSQLFRTPALKSLDLSQSRIPAAMLMTKGGTRG